MKRKVRNMFLIGAVLSGISICSVPAFAADSFEYDVLDDGTITITGYSGSEELTIPNTIDGYTVSAIEESAFEFESFSSVCIFR